jgi:hypothetical protein
VAGVLAEALVDAQDGSVEGDERHARRRVREGGAEALLARAALVPRVLVEPPGDDVDGAQREDEHAVMPAHAHGFCHALWWSKTECGSSRPMRPWCTST